MLLIAEGHDDWHHADLSSLRLSSLALVLVPLAVGKHNLNDSIAAGSNVNVTTSMALYTLYWITSDHALWRLSEICMEGS